MFILEQGQVFNPLNYLFNRLQKRFEEFLIMCHGRARRQLFSRITKLLHNSKRVRNKTFFEIKFMIFNLRQYDQHYTHS